ncbi:MAG: DnaJ domain-containing protein [Heteroscytonema crispum UTEX LB 1556]
MYSSSDLSVYYHILGLPIDATEQEIKVAYRQLAWRYHPDVNPGDRNAEALFKQVVEAYQILIAFKQSPQAFSESQKQTKQPKSSDSTTPQKPASSAKVRFYVRRPEQHSEKSEVSQPNLSAKESLFKLDTLKQLEDLVKRQKWQQAIALAENLATRFPKDSNLSQWQAYIYHGWARKLLERKQYDSARIYLKKALQTDPHNRRLWNEIEKDYQRIERQFKL